MSALRLLSRDSAGDLTLVSYHPASSATWYWYIKLSKRDPISRGWGGRARRRTGQWHDYYRLPFGRTLIVGHQDYHRKSPNTQVREKAK